MSGPLLVFLCGVGGVILGIPFLVGCIVLYVGIQDEIESARWERQREAPAAHLSRKSRGREGKGR